MKKLLLFSFGFLFSFNALNAQVPPPPCGLSPVFVCDSDEDGEVIVDLTEKFPFNYCNCICILHEIDNVEFNFQSNSDNYSR